MRFLLCVALAVVAAGQPPTPPVIVMSVWYNGPRLSPPQTLSPRVPNDALREDLATIKRAGFNGITTWISWRDGEPRRGELDVAQLDRLVDLAREASLYVTIGVYTHEEPEWKKDGTNALAGAFYERVRDHFADRNNAVTVRFGASDAPSRIRLGASPPALGPREARLEIWSAFVRGSRRWSFQADDAPRSPDLGAVGELAGLLTANQALFAPLAARTSNNSVQVEPAGGISVHILESAEAIVIVGLNHTDRTRRVKLTFPEDLPEAIWQNMEAGNAVNFVAGPRGPSYEHTFSPQDALVLAIRKKLR